MATQTDNQSDDIYLPQHDVFLVHPGVASHRLHGLLEHAVNGSIGVMGAAGKGRVVVRVMGLRWTCEPRRCVCGWRVRPRPRPLRPYSNTPTCPGAGTQQLPSLILYGHTPIHLCTHTPTHPNAHTTTHPPRHHTYTPIHPCTHAPTHIHTPTPIHPCTHTHPYTRTPIHPCTHACYTTLFGTACTARFSTAVGVGTPSCPANRATSFEY